MRKRIVLLSAAMMLSLHSGTFWGESLFAQAHPPDGAAAAPHSTDTLWTQTDWLRLEIVGGRIVLESARCGQHCLAVDSAAAGEARQSLKLCAQPGSLVAHYELHDERGQLTLSLERNKLVLSLRPSGTKQPAEICFTQPPRGDVTLEIRGKTPQTWTAADIWHLAILEPEIAERHLFPLLAQLRPNWRVGEQADQVAAALLARAGRDVLSERRAWRAAVEGLAAESFAQRQAADRQLRAAGQGVLAFLRSLDCESLDTEQRGRIQRILADNAHAGPDSPARVAAWMLDDKRVWLALLGRGELPQRIAAAEHLSQLCGRSLSFDPQASADQRQAQLAELRLKLAEN
ncbi:MAG: hypothetical protein WD872_20250 [Pirellulaceae bacterium]